MAGKETLAERAYRLVREDIQNRKIAPGRVLVENDICRAYSVSKATAGEVLHRLTEEGIMKAFPRRGYQLNIYDEEDFVKIQELRFALEALVVRRITNHVDPSRLEEVFTSLQEMDNYTFHITLASLAEDEFILDSLRRLLLKVGTTYGNIELNPEDEANIVKRHRAIVSCLKQQDEQAALAALKEDLRLNASESAFLPENRRTFTTEQMADLVYLSDPQVSPDGRWAAFTRHKAGKADGRFTAEAILRDMKTGAETVLGKRSC